MAEEPVFGVGAGRAGDRVVPRLPSRAPLGRLGCASCVVEESGVERVADASLEGAEGFLGGLALCDLAVIEAPALAVTVPDLGHCGHVDGWVSCRFPRRERR